MGSLIGSQYRATQGTHFQLPITTPPPNGSHNPQSKLASQIVAKRCQTQRWFVLTAYGNIPQRLFSGSSSFQVGLQWTSTGLQRQLGLQEVFSQVFSSVFKVFKSLFNYVFNELVFNPVFRGLQPVFNLKFSLQPSLQVFRSVFTGLQFGLRSCLQLSL